MKNEMTAQLERFIMMFKVTVTLCALFENKFVLPSFAPPFITFFSIIILSLSLALHCTH